MSGQSRPWLWQKRARMGWAQQAAGRSAERYSISSGIGSNLAACETGGTPVLVLSACSLEHQHEHDRSPPTLLRLG